MGKPKVEYHSVYFIDHDGDLVRETSYPTKNPDSLAKAEAQVEFNNSTYDNGSRIVTEKLSF